MPKWPDILPEGQPLSAAEKAAEKQPTDYVAPPMPEDESKRPEWIRSIFEANKHLNFVQRHLALMGGSKDEPVQANPPTPDPSISTLRMASGEGDGKYYVYPTLAEDPLSSSLFSPPDAFKYATQSGERIQFPDAASAKYFGTNYKKGYGPPPTTSLDWLFSPTTRPSKK